MSCGSNKIGRISATFRHRDLPLVDLQTKEEEGVSMMFFAFLRSVARARGAVFSAFVVAGLAGAAAPARAEYPDHPVRVMVPFGPGGVADVTARLVAEKLSQKLGQNFVIENMPGPGGIA